MLESIPPEPPLWDGSGQEVTSALRVRFQGRAGVRDCFEFGVSGGAFREAASSSGRAQRLRTIASRTRRATSSRVLVSDWSEMGASDAAVGALVHKGWSTSQALP